MSCLDLLYLSQGCLLRHASLEIKTKKCELLQSCPFLVSPPENPHAAASSTLTASHATVYSSRVVLCFLPFIGLHRTRHTRVSAVSLSGDSNSTQSGRLKVLDIISHECDSGSHLNLLRFQIISSVLCLLNSPSSVFTEPWRSLMRKKRFRENIYGHGQE